MIDSENVKIRYSLRSRT